MFEMQFGVSLDDIIKDIDPIKQYHQISVLNSESFINRIITPINAYGTSSSSSVIDNIKTMPLFTGVAMCRFDNSQQIKHKLSVTFKDQGSTKSQEIKNCLEHYS